MQDGENPSKPLTVRAFIHRLTVQFLKGTYNYITYGCSRLRVTGMTWLCSQPMGTVLQRRRKWSRASAQEPGLSSAPLDLSLYLVFACNIIVGVCILIESYETSFLYVRGAKLIIFTTFIEKAFWSTKDRHNYT